MKKPLTVRELETYRHRLLDALASQAWDVEAVEEEALQPPGGLRFQDFDEPVEEAALQVELATLATHDRLGYEIHDALQRVADGTYGRCEDCQQEIARHRLDLLPAARRCASCEREDEVRR